MDERVDQYADIKRIGDRSQNGVFIYQPEQHQFFYVNAPFAQIFQHDAADICAHEQIVLDCILTEDHNYLRSRFDELLASGSINTTELKVVIAGHEQKDLSCDVYFLDDTKTILGFVRDVTGEKEHEDFLVNITAQKDSFLDMITHNLSAPLLLSQNLLGWLQKSLKNGDNAGHVESLLSMLQDSTQECIDIVDDFLLEEHKESRGIYVKKTRFSAVEKINTLLDKLQEISPEKKFSITVNLDDNYINTDSVKFFQIIHNLISNAIKFTRPEGRIDIAISEDGGHYLFSIADDGIGIPDELKPHIFDKKSIASRRGLKGERSHGVGLSIIKKLANVIGGELWFESQENKGSVFYLKLPKE